MEKHNNNHFDDNLEQRRNDLQERIRLLAEKCQADAAKYGIKIRSQDNE